MSWQFKHTIALALLWAVTLSGPPTWGQDPPANADVKSESEPTNADQTLVDRIAALQKQVAEAPDLDAESEAKINEMLAQTQAELERATQLETLANADRKLTENVQSRVADQQAALSTDQDSRDDFPETASLSELEPGLATRQAQLQEAKKRLSDLEVENTRRSERRKEIAVLQASHAQRKADIEKQLTAGPADELPLMTAARQLLQQVKLKSLEAELPAHQWELAKYDSEQAVDLPEIRSESARRDAAGIENEVETLRQRIDSLRKQEARSNVQKLRDFAASINNPVLRAAAIRNAELAEENESVVRGIGDTVTEESETNVRLETLIALDKRTRERLERVGLNDAIGLELRKQLSQLPEVRRIQRRSSLRHDTMRGVELKRLEHEDALIEYRKSGQNADASGSLDRVEADYIATLESLTKNYDTYFLELSELDFSENELIKATTRYRSFIDEHVLWIRSDSVFSWRDLPNCLATLREVLSPSDWSDTFVLIWTDFRSHVWLYLCSLLVLGLLLPARFRGRTELTNLGQIAERPSCIQYSVTLRAAALTLTTALAVPVILIFFGWRISSPSIGTSFSIAVSHGLIATGIVLLILDLVRQTCRHNGLAQSHFGWSDRSIALLRRAVTRLKYLMLPFVFLVNALHEYEGTHGNNSLERLCFIVTSLFVGWALFSTLHPRRGALLDFFQKNPDSWITKSCWMWFWIFTGFPIALALIAFIGFYYTAFELAWRYWHTVWIAVSLVGFRAMMIRALQLGHRELHIQKAQERRSALNQETLVPGESPTLENELASLRTINEQAFRILHSGLLLAGVLAIWFLWSGIFPAFNILNQWTLWETTREVAVEVPLVEGGSKLSTETVVDAITPINVLAGIFLAFVTFTSVRNVPGLIEIIVLQRLPLDASFKFAIAMMTRYVILVVGIVFIFTTVGFTWSKLQWLVAALTVGLGFGLQEIFGNLVSGMIILWEQPIRIGDVVTLDGVTGTVSRIEMRATTISDWDHKEYVVPNKDFVTGRVLNWTRSDRLNRLVIPVGVAYEADVERALQLLIRVAAQHPNVMDDPPPIASFDDFGDSTLNLSLRCFLPDLSQRLGTKTELHVAINREFQAAGIEIAFPQQDLHLRTLPEELEKNALLGIKTRPATAENRGFQAPDDHFFGDESADADLD